MKLAFIAPFRIPAHTANSIQGMKMAQAFQRLGHELILFLPGEPPPQSWEELAEHYGLSERIELRWLPNRPALRGYGHAARALAAARRWGADLVYTRLPQAAALASKRSIPTILEVHDLPGGWMGPRLLNTFLRGPGSRRLVLISHALAEALGERFELPEEPAFTLVAHDGVDVERYAGLPDPSQARAQLALPEAFTAGYTGHLYAGRGVELILELARQSSAIQFLLVGGQSEDVARVAGLAQDAGLRNLTLTGFVPNAHMPLYQAACDVLLMPYQERVAGSSGGDIAPFLSPMKMFEYLASGRPILASDLPVLGEVLDDRNAVILPMKNVGAWVEALQSLRGDARRRQRLGQAAAQSAAQRSWQARAARILEGL